MTIISPPSSTVPSTLAQEGWDRTDAWIMSKTPPKATNATTSSTHRSPERACISAGQELGQYHRDHEERREDADDDQLADILRAEPEEGTEVELESDAHPDAHPDAFTDDEQVIGEEQAEEGRPARVEGASHPHGEDDQHQDDPAFLDVLERFAESALHADRVAQVGKVPGIHVQDVEQDEDCIGAEEQQEELVGISREIDLQEPDYSRPEAGFVGLRIGLSRLCNRVIPVRVARRREPTMSPG